MAKDFYDDYEDYGIFGKTAASKSRKVESNRTAASEENVKTERKAQYLMGSIRSGDEIGSFYGGTLVQRQSKDGPILSFVVDDISDEDHECLEKYGNYFHRNRRLTNFLIPTSNFHEVAHEIVHGKTIAHHIYNYVVPTEGIQSFAQLVDAEEWYKIEDIFNKLLAILKEHWICRGNGAYLPLYFLSMDTTFMDEESNIYILPVTPCGGSKAHTMAPEVLTYGLDGATIRSDIFAVAAISCSIGHGGWDKPQQKDVHPVIKAATSALPAFRPDPCWILNERQVRIGNKNNDKHSKNAGNDFSTAYDTYYSRGGGKIGSHRKEQDENDEHKMPSVMDKLKDKLDKFAQRGDYAPEENEGERISILGHTPTIQHTGGKQTDGGPINSGGRGGKR